MPSWVYHYVTMRNIVRLPTSAGWEEGVGLGVQEQGIQEPIRAGEVRDKQDKYKVMAGLYCATCSHHSGSLYMYRE